ncbi:MAG: type I-U CRISPR-associated protein Cas5/Cas6 [Methanotrichaceae archaeon]|nr:type I-U CRISPR-associated protein Cas5/Cas6 [Methanotrichaceae archaeon]
MARSEGMAVRPTVARFALLGTAAPKLTEGLLLAERIHAALVSLSDGAPVFTGCDAQKRPLSGHGHAHILCESCPSEPEQEQITHVTVYARMGFGLQEQAALQSLSRVWGPAGSLSLALQGLGQAEDFRSSPLLARSRTWISRTPFLSTRHPKVTRAGVAKRDESGLQIGSAEHDLLRLLVEAGLPRPVLVERVAGTQLGEREVLWESFLCRRSEGGGKRAACGKASGFRVQFPEEVQGPVAVGYGAHFGMGGFVPCARFLIASDKEIYERGCDNFSSNCEIPRIGY